MRVITTNPQLTAEEKKRLYDWLLKALVADEYCYNADMLYSILSKLVLWLNGTPRVLALNNHWDIQDTKIYIGRDARRDTPAKYCLLVLLALTQFVERTPALEKVMSTALLDYLLGEATDLNKTSLIESPVEIEGMAFSEDKAAMLLAGEWMTAAGEIVDVTGWQVYATQLSTVVEAEAATVDV